MNRRDWRQFRLLSRDAVRQLIDAALYSRESDPMEFAVWMLALIATPPAFFAAQQIFTYIALVKAPADVVQQVATSHRLFFVVYGMLAAALLAALTWEAVFPDGRDQEVIGVLPVRPHTFAAARLGAAAIVGVAFTAAINVPAAFVYTLMAAGHPSLRDPKLLVGHLIATMMASLTVFFALISLRGIVAVILGPRAGVWLGAALQIVAIILLVDVFFFLPGVLGAMAGYVLRGEPSTLVYPPVWFGALHLWIAGVGGPLIGDGAGLGALAFVGTALLTIPIYLLPAKYLGRRALERRSRQHATGLALTLRIISVITRATPSVRAVFAFIVASLIRSRRHLSIVATYFGLAIAVCVVSFFVLDGRGTVVLAYPTAWLLALPLVFIYFLVLGLRAAFRIPTEIEANWPFRVTPPSLATCVNATALAMFTLAVLPVGAATFFGSVFMWPIGQALGATALQMLAGLMLIECVLAAWTKVPFACGHLPSPDVFKALWPIYGIALLIFAFLLSDWQVAALTSVTALGSYLAFCLTVILTVRTWRWRTRKNQSIPFDVVAGHAVEQLKLSGALN
ncbi:MAG TPA: hypothetical protein VNJ02_01785 [Vicinamibacterales bacterium]|nr:hypothetical protein [Vicinamibacterales bacterium]